MNILINGGLYIIMNEVTEKFVKRLCIICFIVLLFCRILISILHNFFQLYILGTITSEILNFIVLFLAIFLFKNSEVIVYPLIGLIIVNIILLLVHLEPKEYYFKSPDSSNTLVAVERSRFFLTTVDFYEKKYLIFKKKIEDSSIDIDNDYKAFKLNDFSLTWLSDKEVDIYIPKGMPRHKVIKLD